MPKTFEIETLSQSNSFFDNADDAPLQIEGLGQKVYWKGCTVLECDSNWTVVNRHPVCDGEAIVKKGTNLWFGEGKVKMSPPVAQ